MLASGTLKPSPSAIRISKLYQLSGHTVAPTAYRILCVRFTSFVRQPDTSGSAVGATLDTGGWLALARPGLSPGKMRQAYLGAITSQLRGAGKRAMRRLPRVLLELPVRCRYSNCHRRKLTKTAHSGSGR